MRLLVKILILVDGRYRVYCEVGFNVDLKFRAAREQDHTIFM